jgi:hypothetical protein
MTWKKTKELMSNIEVNKTIRVLTGERLKYTVRIHKPDGSVIELQTDSPLSIGYNVDARMLFVLATLPEYKSAPVCEWQEGMVILHEVNPVPAT